MTKLIGVKDELWVLLKEASHRLKKPMSQIVEEAFRESLDEDPQTKEDGQQ